MDEESAALGETRLRAACAACAAEGTHVREFRSVPYQIKAGLYKLI
jgi:hypothetical protein